jgi:hypothetical protein
MEKLIQTQTSDNYVVLQRLCQIPVGTEIAQEYLLSIYRGKLAEQFVAQELQI